MALALMHTHARIFPILFHYAHANAPKTSIIIYLHKHVVLPLSSLFKYNNRPLQPHRR